MIAADNIAKTYGGRVALAPTTMTFAAGQTTVLIGPSGCGKTTLLRILLGLTPPDSGRVRFDDAVLGGTTMREIRHRVGYIIQDGGLFPHLTARANAALLARHLGKSGDWIDARMGELARLARLPGDALERYPQQLSGGQRQRVALIRALMLDPPYLLLDEPLGALDPMTRHALQRDLKEIFATMGKTVLLVTHDLHEAAFFAGEIILMREGVMVQRGPLEELLEHPAQPFVTEYIRAQRADPRLALQ
ncbi:MAG: ATP-binding cassette domain-containing protein [Betaproteobacteria bacterium]|nr:ATP-binding cassette domain-containing protein [Betaproteobacteria bacterium]